MIPVISERGIDSTVTQQTGWTKPVIISLISVIFVAIGTVISGIGLFKPAASNTPNADVESSGNCEQAKIEGNQESSINCGITITAP